MPAEPPIRALRVHLGAHKTATTHLQKALHKHRAALRAADIDFIRPAQLRAALAAGEGRLRLPWREAARFRTAIDGLATGAETLGDLRGEPAGQIRDLFDDVPLPRPRDARRAARPPRRRYPPEPLPLDPPVRPPLALGPRRSAAPPRPRPRPHRPPAPDRAPPAAELDRRRRPAPARLPAGDDPRLALRGPRRCTGGARRRLRRRRHRGDRQRRAGRKARCRPRRGRPAGRGGHRPQRRAEVAAIYAAHPAASGDAYAPFDAARWRRSAGATTRTSPPCGPGTSSWSSIDRRGPPANSPRPSADPQRADAADPVPRLHGRDRRPGHLPARRGDQHPRRHPAPDSASPIR